jgi:TonB-dependent receptor
MQIRILRVLSAISLSFLLLTLANAQTGRGAITGHVVDSGGAVLPGAKIQLQPGGLSAVSDNVGQFTISTVAPGNYTITIRYVGFADFSKQITVGAGTLARVDASLKVASKNEEIVVTSERAHGEAEAINEMRESDNILQVLPVEVITSLPNTNIADAVGRLPSVTLERDEGEGKYIQIRGAEPRYNNVTINGIEVPSPESGVRQIKLDIIPANLIDSVELNKTLSANQDGDAIGGSVNLVSKAAEDRPTLYLNGLGGYTPILGGRTLSEFDGYVGQRFGANKKLGILFGASYDWNGRGINDVEPVPTVVGCGGGQCVDFSADSTAQAPYFTSYNTEDIRNYRYNRTRYGYTGSIDYKLSDISGVYARFLYSHFDNFGDRWLYTPSVGTYLTPTQTNPDGAMSANVQARRPVEVIGSLQAGGKHDFSPWLLIWEAAASRSAAEDHGYSSSDFGNANSYQFTIDPNIHTPGFIPQTGVNIFDTTQYTLSDIDFSHTYSPQLNLEGAFSVARTYTAGGHFGTFEFGAKLRNAHKFEDAFDPVYNINGTGPLMSSFLGSFTNPTYYDGRYPGSFTAQQADYSKIVSYFNANQGAFTLDQAGTTLNTYSSNYDLVERIAAGYAMNTLQFGRIRLQTGLRLEGTSENVLGNEVGVDANGNPTFSPLRRTSSYLDPLPSAQVRFGLGPDSAIRVSYGRGIARPNFGDLPPSFDVTNVIANQPNGQSVGFGNPNLKPTHSNNFDVLFEQYLKPLGLIQGGFFFKQISDPIYESVKTVITQQTAQQNPLLAPYVGDYLSLPINGQSAHLYGLEISFQQHLTFLPGLLNGFGLSANYGYTKSDTSGLPLRTDKPALQRQAPNTFNFSPTYDKGRFSTRLGLSYNGAYIWSYVYQDLIADVNSPTGVSPNPVPLGKKGPFGDTYLYQHTQVDVQASFRMYRGLQFIFSGLNLTNEVFGFYNGSGIYPIQREYYKPSYAFGLRYTLTGEK